MCFENKNPFAIFKLTLIILDMKNLVVASAVLVLILTFSCNTEKVETGDASNITGTYAMTTYETQAGVSENPSGNDKVIISYEDENLVTVKIDYVDESATDVSLKEIKVTKSGSIYNLSGIYSNAEATGSVQSSVVTFFVDYTSGNFVELTATK